MYAAERPPSLILPRASPQNKAKIPLYILLYPYLFFKKISQWLPKGGPVPAFSNSGSFKNSKMIYKISPNWNGPDKNILRTKVPSSSSHQNVSLKTTSIVQLLHIVALETTISLDQSTIIASVSPRYMLQNRSRSNSEQVFRRIMAMWVGLGMRESFAEWKIWTKKRIRQRRRDTRRVTITT